MESKHKSNNLRTLFGVQNIPGIAQIKNPLDGIAPHKRLATIRR